MRIAVFHNLPSGGAKRVLHGQVKWLPKKHAIDLYCFNISEEKMFPLKNFCNKKIIYPIIDFQKFGLFKPFVKYIQLVQIIWLSKKIARKIDSQSYDLVFVTSCQITQAPVFLKFLNTNTVYYAHESFREGYEKNLDDILTLKEKINRIILFFYKKIKKHLDCISIKSADLILCNSKFVKKNLAKIYHINAEVCYPGIDLKKFTPLQLRKEKAILSVGRIIPAKKHDFVIKVIANIPKNQRPALFIVADATGKYYKNELINLAKQLKVQLKIFENITDKELVRLYNKVLAVICAQRNEPLGLVPIEAQACGAPALAVAEGGFLETISDGENGLLFKRNVEDAKKVILKLRNQNFREKLIKYGLESAKYWDYKQTTKKLEKYFIKTLRS